TDEDLDEGRFMSIDIDAANRLLQKKYEEDAAPPPEKIKSLPLERSKDINWQVIAQNYLQMLEQMRDEAHAWNEAFLEEKKRSDRLEARLFDVLGLEGGLKKQENPEEKIAIKSPEQLNRRRANFFTQRKIYEDMNR